MSLTATEETWIKKKKQEEDLLKDIDGLNKTAATAMKEKQDEITAIQVKLSADVKVKRDQIEAL